MFFLWNCVYSIMVNELLIQIYDYYPRIVREETVLCICVLVRFAYLFLEGTHCKVIVFIHWILKITQKMPFSGTTMAMTSPSSLEGNLLMSLQFGCSWRGMLAGMLSQGTTTSTRVGSGMWGRPARAAMSKVNRDQCKG